MNETTHTPGPWAWKVNRKSRIVELQGGSPKFDQTVMGFKRYGFSGAQPTFVKHWVQWLNVMEPASDLAVIIKGREHHEDWARTLEVPDARLIAAAPDLLAALIECELFIRVLGLDSTHAASVAADARAAIAKAKGA